MGNKSHYFVQKPPEETFEHPEKVRECAYCGRLFEYHVHNQKYCCKECYYYATKKIKADWFQDNKDRLMEKQTKNRREMGMLPREEYFRRRNARDKRNKIIKSELIGMELMNFQNKYLRKSPLDFRSGRKGFNQEKVDLIKSELTKLELYTEQIQNSDKYQIDFSQEFKGSMVRIDGDIKPPELPLKK